MRALLSLLCLCLVQNVSAQPLLLGQGSVRPRLKVAQWQDAAIKCLPEISRAISKDKSVSLAEIFSLMAKVFELRNPVLQYRWVEIQSEGGGKKQLRFEAVNQDAGGRWRYSMLINKLSREGFELEKRVDGADEQQLNKEIGASSVVSDERSTVYSYRRTGASFQIKHQKSEVDEIQVYLPQKHLQLFCRKLHSGATHCRCTPR